MKNVIDIIQTAVSLFLAFGGGTWLAQQLKLNAAKQKNENVKFMETVAGQVVLGAQKFHGSGAIQQKEALAQAQDRLEENNLAGKFNVEQIAQYIEKAYTALKTNGELDAVKKIVSDADYEAAKKEIEGEK